MRNTSSRILPLALMGLGWYAAVACSSNDSTPDEPDDAAAPTADAAPDSASPMDSTAADTAIPDSAPGSVLPAVPGYTVSVFATGGTQYKGPDSIDLDGAYVWVGYQMGTKSKDGTDAGPPFNSTVVQYNLDGTLTGKQFNISGHCDGVRVDPATHIVWATSNEDGNPVVMSYDPSSSTSKTYTFAAPPHGGGFDDLAFINGQMIIADSAPVLDGSGNNTAPALSSVHVSGTTLTFSPVLMGNATATDPLADANVTLNLTDPDSLAIDDKGNLVLVDQGDSQLIFMKPGSGSDAGLASSVTRLSVGTQLDDTVWATKATGMLLVADATTNTIYAIHATFTPGTIYTEAPDDSGVVGFVATLNPSTGAVTPIVIGFKKATGLLFVPQ